MLGLRDLVDALDQRMEAIANRCAERRAQLFMVMDKKVLATSNDNVMEFLRLLQER
eukprot:CAMPEP_0198724512 /NCGR_PEP_ID=MMETSP1475-20131203/1970_1 /TAXON_ID= ORGANISM="Unidentified sp., Strain CCMP1999" /NCGR_SAMPLE_ID=MMETSP1475 /ASSEMBLY_ACC=CAM_ASM_001111 /LENGTH=55 /DNA_ID=CAMNT_0044486053 /DNA_START=275 /DNA_END=442 /DNA_ORIENTATION=+